MRPLQLFTAALAIAGVVHCSSSTTTPKDPTTDAGTDTGTTTLLGACGAGNSCPSGATCYFPIGSCTAKGQCIADPASGTPECKAIEEVCGCDTPAVTGCGYPSGYASAPTTGVACSVPNNFSDAEAPIDGSQQQIGEDGGQRQLGPDSGFR